MSRKSFNCDSYFEACSQNYKQFLMLYYICSQIDGRCVSNQQVANEHKLIFEA